MKNAILLCFGLYFFLVPPFAGAGQVTLYGVLGGNTGEYSVRVTSLKEAKFRSTVKQQFDYSCGSAALATLLTHHYRDPVTEPQVFQYMYERGDQAKIQREGFSLLDIKVYLESHGYTADGFETSLERLAQAGVPAIVLMTDNGYHHFVVIKGLQDGKVLVGDPSMGSRVLSVREFEGLWANRIVFVITNKRDVAVFNATVDWNAGKAPLGMAVVRESLANTMLFMRGRNDF
jgi:hypothetical protein